MNNHLSDKDLFLSYLKHAKVYGEFGAGDSTFFASASENIQEIHSVESDAQWIEETRARLSRPTIAKFYYKEMSTTYRTWGQPGETATNEQKAAYSEPISATSSLDFLLIDGRFRVACALKAYEYLSDKAIIAFDDFINRPHYHLILDYFERIDSGKTMVILRKKLSLQVPIELIKKYELVSD